MLSDGSPVATHAPANAGSEVMGACLRVLLARLATQPTSGEPRSWGRGEVPLMRASLDSNLLAYAQGFGDAERVDASRVPLESPAAVCRGAMVLCMAHQLPRWGAQVLNVAAEGGARLLLSEVLQRGFCWRVKPVSAVLIQQEAFCEWWRSVSPPGSPVRCGNECQRLTSREREGGSRSDCGPLHLYPSSLLGH